MYEKMINELESQGWKFGWKNDKNANVFFFRLHDVS